MPAIWLRDEQQHEQARQLIDEYQQERTHEYRPLRHQVPGVKKKVVVPSLYLISLFNNVFQDRPAS
jgi:hypothetical protein